MFTFENRSMQRIADELNGLSVPFLDGRKWTRSGVRGILTNPKYKGTTLYNFKRSRLRSQVRVNAEKEWIIVPNSFEAIIEPAAFDAAQKVLRNKSFNLTGSLNLAVSSNTNINNVSVNTISSQNAQTGNVTVQGNTTSTGNNVSGDSSNGNTTTTSLTVTE